MQPIRLCILWHLHQPPYVDPLTGDILLPWVMTHGVRDYYEMPRLAASHPGVRLTFNLVPGLLDQIEAYRRDAEHDRFLTLARKPADALSRAEQRFVREHFFAGPRETRSQITPSHLGARATVAAAATAKASVRTTMMPRQ